MLVSSSVVGLCTSELDFEAEESLVRLRNLVEELLIGKLRISRRREDLETSSIVTTCFRNGITDEATNDDRSDDVLRFEDMTTSRKTKIKRQMALNWPLRDNSQVSHLNS
jgi:hypothetical protein